MGKSKVQTGNIMKSGKQCTLYQTWASRGTNKITQEPKPSTSSTFINLSDEDDDEILMIAMEESLKHVNTAESTSTKSSNFPSVQTNCFSDVDSKNAPQQIDPKLINDNKFQPQLKVNSERGGLWKNPSEQAHAVEDRIPKSTPQATLIENLPGFDNSSGDIWIYPTNYPVREYQYNIVETALYKNTLVTLPTGLGKTFIAAVLMYNFYRWYPQGKIVFMAPTKPLVAQQIEACYNIMGIPQNDTAEMTGTMPPKERINAWRNKRVFFLTPQVLMNDLSRGALSPNDVKCLVVDEAHKATGNHAYCQVIRELGKYNKNFRVLALSATPGSDIKAVQQVIENLFITQIELRTEESSDIQAFSHERKVEKIVVKLGNELAEIKEIYIKLLSVGVERLKRLQVLYNKQVTSLSKFMLLKSRDSFRQNPPPNLQPQQYGIVEGDFAMLISLYHGYELLQLHGLRSLYNYLNSLVNGEKGNGRTRYQLLQNVDFNSIIDMLVQRFQPQMTMNGSFSATQSKPFIAGHPKLDKLKEIVIDHFTSYQKAHGKSDTRIMIFAQYRDSVTEIQDMLNRHKPLVKVMSFIGQSSAGKTTKGFTQKEQLWVMKEFREGGFNTLVSTCVGEEGLDIGDVDFIICYDAHKSPIRLVQRMGRTGRKRGGRIVMLVTEGKEESVYNQSVSSKKSIHKAILNGTKSLHYYLENSRMVPNGLNPIAHKMFITVDQKLTVSKNSRKKTCASSNNNIHFPTGKKSNKCDGFLTEDELSIWKEKYEISESFPKFKKPSQILCLKKQNDKPLFECDKRTIDHGDWMPWQNRLQKIVHIDHSLETRNLVNLIEFMEVQGSVPDDEDLYRVEMAAYLNNDDILLPGETEADADGIQKYCKQPTAKKHMNPLTKQNKKKGIVLPEFSSADEGGISSSENELPPAFHQDVNADKPERNDLSYKNYASTLNFETKTLKRKSSPCDNASTGKNISSTLYSVSASEKDNTIRPQRKIKQSTKRAGNRQRNSKSGENLESGLLSLKGRKKINLKVKKNPVIELLIDADDEGEFIGEPDKSISPEHINKISTHEDNSKSVESMGISDKERKYPFDISIRTEIAYEKVTACHVPSPPNMENLHSIVDELGDQATLSPVDILSLIDQWEEEKLVLQRSAMEIGACSLDKSKSKQPSGVDIIQRSKSSIPEKPLKVKLFSEVGENIENQKACKSNEVLKVEVTENAKSANTATDGESLISLAQSNILNCASKEIKNEEIHANNDELDTDTPTEENILRVKMCSEDYKSPFQVIHSPKFSLSVNLFDDESDSEFNNLLENMDLDAQKLGCNQFQQYLDSEPRNDKIINMSASLKRSTSPNVTPIKVVTELNSPHGKHSLTPGGAELTQTSKILLNNGVTSTPVIPSCKLLEQDVGLDELLIDKNDDISVAAKQIEVQNSCHFDKTSVRPCQLTFTQALNCLEDSQVDVNENAAANTCIPNKSTYNSPDTEMSAANVLYSNNLKSSYSQMLEPKFEMDFDFEDDDDVIPASPCKTSSQMISLNAFTSHNDLKNKSAPTSGDRNSNGRSSPSIIQTKNPLVISTKNDFTPRKAFSSKLSRKRKLSENDFTIQPAPKKTAHHVVDDESHTLSNAEVSVVSCPSNGFSTKESTTIKVDNYFSKMEINRSMDTSVNRLNKIDNDKTSTSNHSCDLFGEDDDIFDGLGDKTWAKLDEYDLKVENCLPASQGFISKLESAVHPQASKQLTESQQLKKGNISSEVDSEDELIIKKKKAKVIDSPSTPFSSQQDVRLKSPINVVMTEFKTPLRPAINKKSRKIISPQIESDDEFASPVKEIKMPQPSKRKENIKISKLCDKGKDKVQICIENRKKQKKYREKNEFLVNEAELSDDGVYSSDEADDSLDFMEASFINDQTQMTQTDVSSDMHAMYMRSVASPTLAAPTGRYKLQYNHPCDTDVYSQAVEEDDLDDYEEDSFCVGSNEEISEAESTSNSSFTSSIEKRCQKKKVATKTSIKGKRRIKKMQSSSESESDDGSKAASRLNLTKSFPATHTSNIRLKKRGMKILDKSDTSTAESPKPPVSSNKNNHYSSTQACNILAEPITDKTCSNSETGTQTFYERCLKRTTDTLVPDKFNVISNESRDRSSDVVDEPQFDLGLDGFDDVSDSQLQNLILDQDVYVGKHTDYKTDPHVSGIITDGLISYGAADLSETNHLCTKTENNKKSEFLGNVTLIGDNKREERLKRQKLAQEQFRIKMAKKHSGSISCKPNFAGISSYGNTVISNQRHCSPLIIKPVASPNLSHTVVNSSFSIGRKHKNKLVILVDSKEINGAQDIVSALRLEQSLNPVVCQLTGCDYIVSNRMAVDRKNISDFINGANKSKIAERLRHMCDLFDRPCLIVEKDRVKSGEKVPEKPMIKTKYVESLLSSLALTHIKLVFSDSQVSTAEILAELCKAEERKNMSITASTFLGDKEIVLKIYNSIPRVSYVTALNFCQNFKCLVDFMKSPVELIQTKGNIGRSRAASIYDYIRHNFGSAKT